MSLALQQFVPSYQIQFVGQYQSDLTGNALKTFTHVGETCLMYLRFGLPRNALTTKGATLTGCALNYNINSGGANSLTSAVPSLSRYVTINGAIESATAIPLVAPSPAFALSEDTVVCRPVSAVVTPVAQDQAATNTVSYLYSVLFTAAKVCTLEIAGIDLFYNSNTTAATTSSAVIVADYTYNGDNSGITQQISSSGATRLITLPPAASNLGASFVMTCVQNGNPIRIIPNAGERLIGLGINGFAGTIDKYFELATPAIGDGIVFESNGTGWVAQTASGTWTRQA